MEENKETTSPIQSERSSRLCHGGAGVCEQALTVTEADHRGGVQGVPHGFFSPRPEVDQKVRSDDHRGNHQKDCLPMVSHGHFGAGNIDQPPHGCIVSRLHGFTTLTSVSRQRLVANC